MFEVGQVFHKQDCNFCVLNIFNFGEKQYLLMSVEHEKLEYLFYEVYQTNNGYNLRQVTDDATNFALFALVENEKNEE